MGGQVNIGGAWKSVNGVYVNIGGVWKPALSMKCNIGGVWKDGWTGIRDSLLLHMNGTNGSTVFTDSSPTPKTFTAYGNAKISTAQSKFGGASAYFDGTGDYIDTPAHTDFNIGNGDFTIDCWIKLSNTAIQYICGQCDLSATKPSSSLGLYINDNNNLVGNIYSGNNNYPVISTAQLDANWNHVAFIRNGNTLKLYINGVNDGSRDVTGVTANTSTNKFAIGRLGEYNNFYFTGYIDEFRFTKGVARWTSNFTPPTTEY